MFENWIYSLHFKKPSHAWTVKARMLILSKSSFVKSMIWSALIPQWFEMATWYLDIMLNAINKVLRGGMGGDFQFPNQTFQFSTFLRKGKDPILNFLSNFFCFILGATGTKVQTQIGTYSGLQLDIFQGKGGWGPHSKVNGHQTNKNSLLPLQML